jgi:hypothetical protein
MQTSAKASSKVVVRLPAELHERLRAQAAANERSLNGEIVDALERHVTTPAGQPALSEDEARLREAIARSERGETDPLTREALATLRREIKRGTPADEALARAGLAGGAAGG